MKKLHWPRITRDSALFLAGLGLTINEAVLRHGPERPSLLILFAAMMGLPFVLRGDEKGGGLGLGLKPKPKPDEPPTNEGS